jgi:hypothetical protein
MTLLSCVRRYEDAVHGLRTHTSVAEFFFFFFFFFPNLVN